jgi:hypothetical protein
MLSFIFLPSSFILHPSSLQFGVVFNAGVFAVPLSAGVFSVVLTGAAVAPGGKLDGPRWPTVFGAANRGGETAPAAAGVGG